MSIIRSLLDTDLYKLTMMNAVIQTCSRLGVEIPTVQYKFKCRNNKDLLPFKDEIVKEINSFQKLRFTESEINYLCDLNYFPSSFAANLRFVDLHSVQVAVYEKNGELNIDIEGKWVPAILFEVPVLAIVNEIYFKHHEMDMKIGMDRRNLKTFISEMDGMRFADFGTRRRFSKAWQNRCIFEALKANLLTGTSNVYFAKEFGIKPVGTMAHEWLQAFQALSRDIRNFQVDALNHWMLTYRGKLDTALTDIIGIDAFLNDWDPFFAENYSCLRHDSGCPIEFIDKVNRWYKKNDREMPRLLFSDGLTPKEVHKIVEYADTKSIETAFGIGTNFTNNVGLEPLQIVIKLNKVNGQNVIKLSDSPGKVMCDDKNLIHTLKVNFNLK